MTTGLLGLDVGTTTCKAVLIDLSGAVLAAVVVPYSSGPAPDDPREWWATLAIAVDGIRSALDGIHLAGVGVCGRGSGVAFVTAQGHPVQVPWPDVRARIARLKVPATASYQKLARWGRAYRAIARTSEKAASSIAAVLSVKDYIALRLTGMVGADPSNASCLAWPDAPERYGLPGGVLPPLRPMHSRLGTVTVGAARGLGLLAGVPVAVGGHDGVCANIGAGMLKVGEGCLTLGTHGVVRINTAGPLYSSRTLATFTYPFVGGAWTSGGDAAGAGAAMVWLARTLGYQTSDAAAFFRAHEALDALAAGVPVGADGVRFLPFLMGMVSPQVRPDASAAFIGLRVAHGPGHLVRAVMEGGAFALRSILERFEGRAPCRGSLRLTGGGSRSHLWAQIVATVVGRRLGLVDAEPSARGAAILAAVAARMRPDVQTAVARMVNETGEVRPVVAERKVYDRAALEFERRVRAALREGRCKQT